MRELCQRISKPRLAKVFGNLTRTYRQKLVVGALWKHPLGKHVIHGNESQNRLLTPKPRQCHCKTTNNFDTSAPFCTRPINKINIKNWRMSRFPATFGRLLCNRLRCTNAPMRLHPSSAKQGIQKAIFRSKVTPIDSARTGPPLRKPLLVHRSCIHPFPTN